MTEPERRQLTISSAPRLSPEEIAAKTFSSSFRGIAESEVRAFLRRVGDELASARDKERELGAAVDALEAQLRSPQPLDEQRMLDVLGEETTRLLRSAREAAQDIRSRAEERSAAILSEAQEEARRMREEAEEILGVRTREADVVREDLLRAADEEAAGVRADVERLAEEQRLRVVSESDAAIEASRTQGREMLEEAKSLRERILADLGRRRSLLQGQIEELRTGRDQLLDAYRVVKRTFLEATEALVQVEARVAAERAPRVPVGPDEAATVGTAEEPEGPNGGSAAAAAAGGPIEGPGAETVSEEADEQRRGRAMAHVDSLFARLREERATGDDAEGESDGAEPAPPESEQEAGPTDAAEQAGEEPVVQAGDSPEIAAPDGGEGSRRVTDRDAVLAPMVGPLVKVAKRAAQDEQNEILDAVRRQKGRGTSETVLSGAGEWVAAWSDSIGPGLSAAYAAGSAAVSGEQTDSEPDAETLAGLVETVISPLRERLSDAIADLAEGGPDAESLVTERIGARYREWKTQDLETLLLDALSGAYARGAYCAAPEGALLDWVPSAQGRCPDCDDNALEPTAKGAEFPTGQLHPPAHPGCRCVALPAAGSAAAEAAPPA